MLAELLVDVHTTLYYVCDDFEASVLNICRPDSQNVHIYFLVLPIASSVQSFRDGDERVEEFNPGNTLYYATHGTPLGMLCRKLCSCNAETHSSYLKRHKATFAHFCAVIYTHLFSLKKTHKSNVQTTAGTSRWHSRTARLLHTRSRTLLTTR